MECGLYKEDWMIWKTNLKKREALAKKHLACEGMNYLPKLCVRTTGELECKSSVVLSRVCVGVGLEVGVRVRVRGVVVMK